MNRKAAWKMTQFALRIFGLFAFIGLLALIAPRSYAADIPAYAGPGSEDLTKTITSGPSPSASEEVPLDRPNIEITALLPWVADTVTGSLNLRSSDYKDTLKSAARSFTREGWVDFTRMLQKYRVITNLQQNTDQTVTVEPGAASLSREDIENGIYRWSVTMPVTINYFSERESHTDYITLNLMVIRVPRKDNILGIGIDKWLEAER